MDGAEVAGKCFVRSSVSFRSILSILTVAGSRPLRLLLKFLPEKKKEIENY